MTEILDMFEIFIQPHAFTLATTDYNADVKLERVKTPNKSRRLGTTSRNPSRRDLLNSVTGKSEMSHIETQRPHFNLQKKTHK